MQQPKMFSSGKHSRGLTPQAIQLFPRYTQFFVKAGKAKLEEYHRQVKESNVPPDPELVASVEAKIEEAQTLEEAFRDLSGAVRNVYDCNYREIAQILRTAMLKLGYRSIEDSPELYLIACLIMDWLKSQNESFSRQMFTNFINYGKEIV